jgi:hypothetical protein
MQFGFAIMIEVSWIAEGRIDDGIIRVTKLKRVTMPVFEISSTPLISLKTIKTRIWEAELNWMIQATLPALRRR